MYNGSIPGPGPRYCPAIEDKIARFPEKTSHQLFIEPEGLTSPETYCNNLPTGLPLDVQEAFLHKIPGLEHCLIVRPGYAIEYDCVESLALTPALESKAVPGLWFAGQINGTSGYEEAAAQGLWAACNMGCAIRGEAPFLPGREASYMAVLVDDLVTRGTDEPYRMFTSRAEHRLLLREGNADLRLTPPARALGLVGEQQWRLFSDKRQALDSLLELLRDTRITPDAPTRERFADMGENPPSSALSLAELLRRPGFGLAKAAVFNPAVLEYPDEVRAEAETRLVYEGYLGRQEDLAARREEQGKPRLPADLDYAGVSGLSAELREKLERIRPLNLGQASRIRGMTPAAVACLEIHLKKLAHCKKRL
jgi:tRNA uridine 5-carboxymethylaminomethyl modification enzyme